MFSFPPTTGMFRFAGFAPANRRVPCLRMAGCPIRVPADQRPLAPPRGISLPAAPSRGGLPHSDTHGSMAVRASPWPFAACRVLLRLREPRHPPYALTRFSLSRAAPAPADDALVSLFSCVCFPSILSKIPRPDAAYSPRGALVENAGLEPATPGLQSRCSSRLSQSPNASVCVVPGRLELPTPTLSVWCSNRLSYGTPPWGPPQAFSASTGLGNAPTWAPNPRRAPPERRCSSRTFRYGYLVTT